MKSLQVKSITDRILHIYFQNYYFKNRKFQRKPSAWKS